MSCVIVYDIYDIAHIAELVNFLFFFFFNDTATTEIYTLSLHDALPISPAHACPRPSPWWHCPAGPGDRKSTRLNSSHLVISYAVFCLKKKKNIYGSNSSYNRVTCTYLIPTYLI